MTTPELTATAVQHQLPVDYRCSPLRARFDCPPTLVRPMRLAIEWRSHTVVVEAFAPAPRAAAGRRKAPDGTVRGTRLVWASVQPQDAYLDLSVVGLPPTLWLAGTAFDLSDHEAHKLVETLGPVGLRINHRQPRAEIALSERGA